MLRVLLPLNMYGVKYEVAHGRPYSRLEELLLKAVNNAEGAAGRTFDDLKKLFMVHDRLLTEGLVTLIQEGWLAMVQQENEVRYLVTKEGRLTIEHGRRPSKLRVHTRHARILRERLTGQLARASDLRLVTGPTAVRATGSRNWKKYALAPRLLRTKINGGEAEHLLPRSRERQERISWIDSVARLNTDLYYLPVQVDLEKSEVMGVPQQWRSLTPLILAEVVERYEELAGDVDVQEKLSELMRGTAAKGRAEERGVSTSTASSDLGHYAQVSVRREDFALTDDDRHRFVESVLAECSGNVLVIAAAMDVQKAGVARDLLARLRQRGVNADLLWSCDTAETAAQDVPVTGTDAARSDPADQIDRLLGASRTGAGSGKVEFARAPAQVATDLVLAVTERGPVAVMGVDLLDSATGHGRFSPVVRLSDPAALASVARLCAGWWEELRRSGGSLPAHRWKHLAQRWAGEAALLLGTDSRGPFTESRQRPDSECAGTVLLLSGPQAAALREEVQAGRGRHLLLADSDFVRDDLMERITRNPSEDVVRPFRAAGGVDGWRFAEWVGDAWKTTHSPGPHELSPHCRVTAGDDHWLVEPKGAGGPALSFSVSGDVATQAWERMRDEAARWAEGESDLT
ncbi:hypothetical protein ACFXKY_35280 [Streptomyces canus]|uniref:hypothetical protein n=1 Tax=Streptomyces canus TaxID=58343 RepID=UPI0036B783DD